MLASCLRLGGCVCMCVCACVCLFACACLCVLAREKYPPALRICYPYKRGVARNVARTFLSRFAIYVQEVLMLPFSSIQVCRHSDENC